jgi:hypothetical protein
MHLSVLVTNFPGIKRRRTLKKKWGRWLVITHSFDVYELSVLCMEKQGGIAAPGISD